MSRVISDDDVIAYSKATGYDPQTARHYLAEMKRELRERVLRAARSQASRYGLRDPIEDDPGVRKLVRRAAAKANRAIAYQGLGRCHLVWETQARILWKDHKIRWYSPDKMDPGALFD